MRYRNLEHLWRAMYRHYDEISTIPPMPELPHSGKDLEYADYLIGTWTRAYVKALLEGTIEGPSDNILLSVWDSLWNEVDNNG